MGNVLRQNPDPKTTLAVWTAMDSHHIHGHWLGGDSLCTGWSEPAQQLWAYNLHMDWAAYVTVSFFSFIAWYSKAQNLKVTAFLLLKVPALSGSWILHCTQHKQTICFLQILIPLHLFYALKREKLNFKVSLFNAFSKTENRGFSQNFLSFNLYFSLNETVISNFFSRYYINFCKPYAYKSTLQVLRY